MSIVRAFDRASRYDQFAHIQRKVAEGLAHRITALPLVSAPRVLEIGCGTGFLGEALAERLDNALWLMTDLSPAMVSRARARFRGRANIEYAVMDGSAPNVSGPFDLICSSLAMQWFADLPAAISRLRALLTPGGWLAFTTLAAGSFAEWRAAHGPLSAGTPDYPDATTLAAMGVDVSIETHIEQHPDGADFLSALKAIGAGTPRPGHRPLTPAQLRTVMRRFDSCGAVGSYVVATCIAGPHR
ncbi:MAG: methyltransferase domain-containing protein [Sphingomonadaceae bacterium]